MGRNKMMLLVTWLAMNVALLGNTLLFELQRRYGKLFMSWEFVDAEFVTITLLTPLLEEAIKWFGFYLLFRMFNRRDAVVASLGVATIFGIVERLLNSGGYITLGLSITAMIYFIFRFGILAANHVLYWSPIALWGFKKRLFPLAAFLHVAWNFGVGAPDPWGFIGTGINLVATVVPALVLFRIAKGGNWWAREADWSEPF